MRAASPCTNSMVVLFPIVSYVSYILHMSMCLPACLELELISVESQMLDTCPSTRLEHTLDKTLYSCQPHAPTCCFPQAAP